MFKPGDKIRNIAAPWLGDGIVDRQEGSKVWTFWKVYEPMTQPTWMHVNTCELIQPAELKYDPTQQGDTDEDI